MTDISDLLERLINAGIPMNSEIFGAMSEVDPSNFTEHSLESFWHDSPVPFMVTESGNAKTISAPHMVVTLLHHLEISESANIIIIGSKGGYIASLIDWISGPGGTVTVIEPNEEVRSHTIECLERVGSNGICLLYTSPSPRD